MVFFTDLKTISTQIIQSTSIAQELRASDELSSHFNKSVSLSVLNNEYNQEINTLGGIAISSKDAAFCVDDKLRTVRFIKGIYAALLELKLRFKNEKINIVYAGCGPFATLLTPLLPFFSPSEIAITLLEINTASIQSIQHIIAMPNIAEYDIKVIACDASLYKKPSNESLHLVISETMFNGLVREPQVAITANLAPQLASSGILIPESIHLSLAYSAFGKEVFVKPENLSYTYTHIVEGKTGHAPYGKVIDLLFKLNKHHNFSAEIKANTPTYTSKWYAMPESIVEYPDVCIYTDITIFKEQCLGLAASYITNPICVHSFYNILPHQEFRLVYTFLNEPIWTIEKRG